MPRLRFVRCRTPVVSDTTGRGAMRDPLSRALCSLGIACALLAATNARAQTAPLPGAAVYAKYCASCHDQVDARIPTRDALAQMSPARILRTLDFGLMMSIAYPIKRP